MIYNFKQIAGCRTLGLICMLGCFTAKGEQPDTLRRDLRDVEVVANRVQDDVVSTAPLYRLSDVKMKAIGVTDMADALHRMPGLNIKDYGGAGGLKTVSARGLGASHTGVIYDGVVLSDCQSGRIDLSRYSLDNVNDMSLVIGDNSDIFVSAKASASAAAIIINTGSIPEINDSALHLTAQLRGGSFGMINPYVKVGKRLNKHLSLSASGDYMYAENDYPFTLYNGILVTRERRHNSRMSAGHGELNCRWYVTESSAMEGKAYYYDSHRRLPGQVVLYNPTGEDALHDRNMFGQLSWLNSSLSRFRFRALAKFNWDATYYHEVDGKYTDGYNDENYIQRECYVAGSAMYTPNDRWAMNYSADYSYNNLSSNDPTTVHPWRHSLLQSLAARFRSDRVLLTARMLYSIYDNGVRAGNSALDRNKLSPSVSVSVRPFTERMLFVRVSYKNIFRMPTFNESYYYRMGSHSLRPENTDQLNLGITWQAPRSGLLSYMTLTADGYYNRVTDKIVALPMNMFIWTMTNLERVRAFGADVTADLTMEIWHRQSLTLTGNYSLQRVQPRTGKTDPDYNKQVAYTPIHSGAASLGWHNPWADVIIKMTGVSDRYGTNSNLPITRIAGYMEFGATVMRDFTFRTHHLNVRVDLLNILDTQYEIVAAYPMPGRSLRCTVTYKL